MPANNEEAKIIKQAKLIYAHKYWLFSLAGGMDSVIEIVKKAFATPRYADKTLFLQRLLVRNTLLIDVYRTLTQIL